MMRQEDDLEHIHRVRYTAMERAAGLFVIIGLVLLILAFVFSRQLSFLFTDTFTLHAVTETAEDVSTDSAVRIAGLDAGRVTDIEWTEDNMVRLTLTVRERFHELVREDSVAQLNSIALIGEPSVEISRGDPQRPVLPDGATIEMQVTPSIDELLSRLAPAVDNVIASTERVRAITHAIAPEDISRLTADLAAAANDARALLDRVNKGKGAVGRLFTDEEMANDIAATAGQLNKALKLTQARLRDIKPLIDASTARAEGMEQLMDDVNKLVTELTGTVESFGAGEGDAIADILWKTRTLLDEAEQTLRAIRNTWPISRNDQEQERVEPVPPQPPSQ